MAVDEGAEKGLEARFWADLPHDTEAPDELGPKVIRIREAQGFWSIALTNWVQRRWPSLLAIRTGTDVQNGLIYIYWAIPGTAGAKQLKLYGRDRGVYMSLLVPLKKLKLKVQRDWQWEIEPYIQPIDDAPFALVLKVEDREPEKRDLAPRKSRAKRPKGERGPLGS